MKFLQLFSGSLGKSPRPTRFYSLLRSLGPVTVCAAPVAEGFEQPETFLELQKHARTPLQKILRAGGLLCHRYEADIWSPPRKAVYERLRGQNFSAIVCQEALLVPLALAVRDARIDRNSPCPVILDAREYYPREFEQSFAWNAVLGGINDYVCRKYFPHVDYIFTVSPGLADEYKKEYGLECEVLPSYPYYQDIKVSPTNDDKKIHCIHHGGAIPERKIEDMIGAFSYLQEKATLDFMLVPNNQRYFEVLKKKAASFPNISFLAPVSMSEIVSKIAAYDMGIYLLDDEGFNHRHALPNKFFEYIQARLALAISPLPDMSALLRQYDLGVVSQDFTPQAFAEAITALDHNDIARFKKNADSAAHELCWERNDVRLREVLFSLLGTYKDNF